MSLTGAQAPRRRRGAALEDALLEAAWEEVVEVGYTRLTMESVAERARTSRAVLYRRWPAKADLVLAALRHANLAESVEVPDTGSLRDDMVALLRNLNESRAWFGITIAAQLTGYFAESGTNLAELRAALLPERGGGVRAVLARAAERGEIGPSGIGDRLARAPLDLYRHELMLTLEPVPEATIVAIVDEVFMPGVRGTL